MTREEAITVFKAFMDNPLFSDVHKAAFNIAVHDIKQRHELDINELVLVHKSYLEQEPILDKIRAEMIEEMLSHSGTGEEVIQAYVDGLKKGLQIIDKYKAGSENHEQVM